MTSRLTALAAALAVLAAALLMLAAGTPSASAATASVLAAIAPAPVQPVRVIQLERVVVVAKRLDPAQR